MRSRFVSARSRFPDYMMTLPYTCATTSDRPHSTNKLWTRVRNKQAYGNTLIIRGLRTKSTFDIEELPQGILTKSLPAKEVVVEPPSYPTVIQQARNHMRKFKNCVLLTRVGGFYELYFEHAELYGPLMNLKIGHKKTTVGPVAMAGFPHHQLDRFLKILVDDHDQSVAISEEYAKATADRATANGLLFDRRVARIVTPGTLVDEKFIDPRKNNFLLALHLSENELAQTTGIDNVARLPTPNEATHSDQFGLAWMDLTTGEFFTQTTSTQDLTSALVRISPREVVMNRNLKQHVTKILPVMAAANANISVAWQDGPVSPDFSSWSPMLESVAGLSVYSEASRLEVVAGSVLLEYVKDRLQGSGLRLQSPTRYVATDSMGIDRNTMKGLELLETSRNSVTGGKGSLLHTIRRTTTKSGARLLRHRIASPSTCLKTINERLDCVEQFVAHPILRESIVVQLKRTVDSQRIVQRLSLGRGDADDLLDLQKTIICTQKIVGLLSDTGRQGSTPGLALTRLSDQIYLAEAVVLANRIASTIDEEGLSARHRIEASGDPTTPTVASDDSLCNHANHDNSGRQAIDRLDHRPNIHEADIAESNPWIMKRTASKILSDLHICLDDLVHEKRQLAASLRKESGAATLSLRWTPALGHICHVRGVKEVKAMQKNLTSIKTASSSKSTVSFYMKDWSDLGTRIDQTRIQITREEQYVFLTLRDEVVKQLAVLRRNAKILDELDVACSFAILAAEQHHVRPVINDSTRHHVASGRHPSVDVGLAERGRSFVANDCLIGEKERIWLITGPNMAGKSTFLRQNALISVLAQAGAYVPAAHAEIGIVDRLFSRIGAADDLYQDQSTFMVEMLETASILSSATPRSLVIMDEVGRGTTPEDGLAIGYACLHHLYHINQCRTLFATHFHKLADMTRGWTNLGTYCSDVTEDANGAFSFVHLLRPGVNRRSHALKVAQLAGVPQHAIDVAKRVLQ